MSERQPIWVSFEDAAVLRELLARALAGRSAATALFLGNELARAQLAPHAELPECMTLGARGRALLEDSGVVRDLVLVPPDAAHDGASLVSVLSETGAALLGLSAGQRLDWRCPRRGWRALRLLSVSRPPLPLRAPT
jgi:regulator of nucleoside diphosphate kinase